VQSRMTLVSTAAAFNLFHTTGVYDVFFVGRCRTAGTYTTPFGSTGTTAEKGLYVAVQPDGTWYFSICKGSAGTPVVTHTPAISMAPGLAKRILFRGDGSNSRIAEGNWSSFSVQAFTSALSTGNAAGDFKIGDYSGAPTVGEGGQNFWDGDVMELLIYNRNLDAGELATMKAYLSSVGA
jgi:hypothetical protein